MFYIILTAIYSYFIGSILRQYWSNHIIHNRKYTWSWKS